MANQEEILDALCSYEKKPSKEIPQVLEDFLRQVAKTGETIFPWSRLKPLFIRKLDQVMEQFNRDVPYDHLSQYPNVENAKYEEMRSRVIDAFEKFSGPPFTVQRICELVTEPRKHYQRTDKFLRGVEKNVMVVSTVDPYGKKISSEPPRILMNGLEVNGFSKPKDDGDGPVDVPPFPSLPSTGWSDNGSVATVWPSVFPEQTMSAQNTSANAISDCETRTEAQSTVEVATSLDKLLSDKSDPDDISSDKHESESKENVDPSLDKLHSETLERKDDSDTSNAVDTNSVLRDSENLHSVEHENSNSEAVLGETLDQDDSETDLSDEARNVNDPVILKSADEERENEATQESEENKDETNEVLKDESVKVSSDVSEERNSSSETTDTALVSENSSENAEESKEEEVSNPGQSEQSSPSVQKDTSVTETTGQSPFETSIQNTDSETDQLKTDGVDQSDTEATQSEAVSHSETAAQNEAVQKEAEAEEMEASCVETNDISSEATEVKDSDEITSSEGMDVDSGRAEGNEDTEVVSTSVQGTEEPMEQE